MLWCYSGCFSTVAMVMSLCGLGDADADAGWPVNMRSDTRPNMQPGKHTHSHIHTHTHTHRDTHTHRHTHKDTRTHCTGHAGYPLHTHTLH